MNNLSTKTWFIITTVVALLLAILVFSYLQGVKRTGTQEVEVVVASQHIDQGSRITPDIVKTIKMPVAYRHEHAFSNRADVVNKFTTVELWPDQIIISDQLTTKETSKDLPYRIPDGNRAITISINAVSGLAGQVKPGHRVDVLLSTKPETGSSETQSLTMLQNILVLAVGGSTGDSSEAASTITLAVTPDQAEYVMLAENTGKMKLTLRPPTDERQVPLTKINLNWLLTQY